MPKKPEVPGPAELRGHSITLARCAAMLRGWGYEMALPETDALTSAEVRDLRRDLARIAETLTDTARALRGGQS